MWYCATFGYGIVFGIVRCSPLVLCNATSTIPLHNTNPHTSVKNWYCADKILVISVTFWQKCLKIKLWLDVNVVHIFSTWCNLRSLLYRAKSWRLWKMTSFWTFLFSHQNSRSMKTFHMAHLIWKYGRLKCVLDYQKNTMIHLIGIDITTKYCAQYQWYCAVKIENRPIYDRQFCTFVTTLLPP